MQKILTIDFKSKSFNEYDDITNIPELDSLLNEEGWQVNRIEILQPVDTLSYPKVTLHLSRTPRLPAINLLHWAVQHN